MTQPAPQLNPDLTDLASAINHLAALTDWHARLEPSERTAILNMVISLLIDRVRRQSGEHATCEYEAMRALMALDVLSVVYGLGIERLAVGEVVVPMVRVGEGS